VDDLIIEFLTETNENLSELDSSLLLLEKNPNDKELLSKIFRVMHTIKGTSGFLGLARLGSIAHKAEDLLGLFRDGKLQPNQQFISLILEAIDAIKKIVEGIEKLGQEEAGDDTSLINRLKDACQGKLDGPIQEILTETAHQLSEEEAYLERLFQETPVLINMPQAEATIEPPTVQVSPPEIPKKVAAPEMPLPSGEAGANAITVQQSLRVNVDVLEDLMTLVSELVLSRNQIMQLARSRTDGEMSSSLQHLSHIVSDLQDGVMKTRMQPVGNAWSKLPRIVRDIANDLGKKIELEMLGQDTELDRQVLEMIKDPLTHMVRNSADHGIEKPDQRITAGKPETGTIKLNSFHAGGYIIIEISDDGKGLPLEKIKSKILQLSKCPASKSSSIFLQPDFQQLNR
jgi:two-component system, chemotaxis family, sensor kinase CheA